MTINCAAASTPDAPILHPLDPLTAAEIVAAVALIRQQPGLGSQVRFPIVTLHEPPKSVVRDFQLGDPMERQAFVVVLDNQMGATYEAIASLTQQRLLSWTLIPGVQPRIMPDEVVECEAVIKANPEFQAALHKRGIANLDLVMVDPWLPGNFGFAEEAGVRLARSLCWLRTSPTDNAYAHPIDGLVAIVDLNQMQVVQIEDRGKVPVPPTAGNYAPEFVPTYREDLKSLQIVQPEGPSFTVVGHQVCWQKWQFRLGFNPREGLVLYTLGYEDQGQLRPILYRASMAEMVVPYGDPRPQHFRKNAFDVGEIGLGSLTNSLKLGCDCLGEIHYFDAVVHTSRGEPVVIENAICLHEEDYGILWKHQDWRIDRTEVRRSRRLVLSFITSIDNYEYGFFWYFYQDGTIQYEVKLTGILLCAALDDTPQYGTLVAPELNALFHQHFFCMRLDMTIDGENNSVVEVNTEAVPLGPDNPYGNAFIAKETLLATESQAQRCIDPLAGRYWKIVNPTVLNRLGKPVSYKLQPGENILPFADPQAWILKRAGFMTRHLWVTPYHPQENYPAGDYPNQHPGGAGLPAWTEADRSLDNTDLVVWYNFGHHHIPRPEDWPVMPVAYIGFMLKPVGFFAANPALDVPASQQSSCH
ncbi:tyramine oxidase [Neosynechococcus sphagnicola sy1]|uniref:Amine oxidase n=1 Tax=Neosynechococcus sphagnicola sy1 TaxID=1497020 RepID=A0A098TR75_9CYAN|nr:primary-amine oxidase [Neosynechococcus sphagnicola]KGF73303.1 tyramine oxidase [Neosynechococcus sphagnicola sy1]